MARRVLLTLHVLGAVGLIGAVATAVALDITAVWWVQADAARPFIIRLMVTMTAWVVFPCAVVVLLTGVELARHWGAYWLRWIITKGWISVVLVGLAAAIITLRGTYPVLVFPVRITGLVLLIGAFVLSAAKPAMERPVAAGAGEAATCAGHPARQRTWPVRRPTRAKHRA